MHRGPSPHGEIDHDRRFNSRFCNFRRKARSTPHARRSRADLARAYARRDLPDFARDADRRHPALTLMMMCGVMSAPDGDMQVPGIDLSIATACRAAEVDY